MPYTQSYTCPIGQIGTAQEELKEWPCSAWIHEQRLGCTVDYE